MSRSGPCLVTTLLLAAACGSSGDTFDITLKGHDEQNAPVDMEVSSNSDGAGHGSSSFNSEDGKDVGPMLVVVGGVEGASTVSGSHCLTSPCPPKGVLTVLAPPPIIYAGPWKAGNAALVFKDTLDTGLGAFDFTRGDSDFTMTFDPPDYSDSGDNVMTATGTLSGSYASSGASVAVSGTFSLSNLCTIQNFEFRSCGNTREPDGSANPLHRPYTENTCPPELVKPFEASPRWTGNTLHLGDIAIDCRVTNGQHTDNATEHLICYQRSTATAGGCDWDVHFATDGAVQAFAVAAFAKSGCQAAVKTCNTYR
jgi:hypothetical protein